MLWIGSWRDLVCKNLENSCFNNVKSKVSILCYDTIRVSERHIGLSWTNTFDTTKYVTYRRGGKRPVWGWIHYIGIEIDATSKCILLVLKEGQNKSKISTQRNCNQINTYTKFFLIYLKRIISFVWCQLIRRLAYFSGCLLKMDKIVQK